MSAKKKLNPASRLAVDELCSTAMTWGWESDQGNGNAVVRAEKRFIEAKAAMEKRLRYLESQLKKHRHLVILLGDHSE